MFAVFVTVMLAAIIKYTKWLDLYLSVENKCSNWHSGVTAPPPLQGPNLVEPADVMGECRVRNRIWAESGLGLICIVVSVSLFFNTHETGQGMSQ